MRRQVITSGDLLGVVRRLRGKTPVTNRIFGRNDLKQSWVGWLSEYSGPGAYRRATSGGSAREVYARLQSFEMLAWLCESLHIEGVDAALLKSCTAHRNKARAAAEFRRAVQWKVVETRVYQALGAPLVTTPSELRAAVGSLSAASPETDRFSAKWHGHVSQQEQRTVWYRHQKEHWLGWLGAYDGAGAYGRQTWSRTAEFVFNHVVNPQMLIWLAEAVKVDRTVVRRAVDAALRKRTMMAMSGAIRRVIPWAMIAPMLPVRPSK